MGIFVQQKRAHTFLVLMMVVFSVRSTTICEEEYTTY